MATKKTAKRSASKAKVASHGAATTAILLNGQATGQRTRESLGSQTVGEVAQGVAREHGLKSFSILVNGVKASTEDAGKAAAGNVSIEVFAKETRG